MHTPNKDEHTTVTGYVRLIVRSLESGGLDGRKLCTMSGINYDQLTEIDTRIEQSKITQLWQHAVSASGNEAIALDLAKNITTDALHLLGYSMMSSLSLLEGCERFLRYQRVVGELFVVSMKAQDDYFELQYGYREEGEPFAPQSIEAAMVVMVSFTRWVTQVQNASPEAVYLMRTAPLDASPYTSLFQCPVYFSQSQNKMHYAISIMALPIPTAHKELSLMHDNLLGGYLERLDKLEISDLVEKQLVNMLPGGVPKAEELASALNLSSRTLHRRLAEVGLNFQSSLEAVRKRLSKMYLETSLGPTTLNLKEIAFLLGFSEPSSFYRAFKRWYGVPPKQFLTEVSKANINQEKIDE